MYLHAVYLSLYVWLNQQHVSQFNMVSYLCTLYLLFINRLWQQLMIAIILPSTLVFCISHGSCVAHLQKLSGHVHANKVILLLVILVQFKDFCCRFLCY